MATEPSEQTTNLLDQLQEQQQKNKRKACDAISISSDEDAARVVQVLSSQRSLPNRPAEQTPSEAVAPLSSNLLSIVAGGNLQGQMSLLHNDFDDDAVGDIGTTPLFTEAVRRHAVEAHEAKGMSKKEAPFKQYGLLAGDVTGSVAAKDDPRVFYNVGAPSSTFICGSQGSGKSHTLSCLLETCLLNSEANTLKKPLTGIVFHYDTFVSDTGGSPCEAAYLSSNPNVDVRVLCAPTNMVQIKKLYKHLPNVKVEELRLNESDLNTKRMMDLMAVDVSGKQGATLYIQIINKVLRDMRMDEQHTEGGGFNYSLFKNKMDNEMLTKEQLGPLRQRLEVLESFMNPDHAKAYHMRSFNKFQRKPPGPPAGKKKKKGNANGGKGQPQEKQQAPTYARGPPPVTNNAQCQHSGFGFGPTYAQDQQPAQSGPFNSFNGNGLQPASTYYGQGQQPGTFYSQGHQPALVHEQEPPPAIIPKFARESIWTPKCGHLTIVDLSCPMVPTDMACSLFNMCLSLFLEQGSNIGRVIALDEAHKYMSNFHDANALTSSIETAIRVQRHIGARVIISTQEPTISPRLLDLCSVTIVHRFTSPDWLAVLKEHLAGASRWLTTGGSGEDTIGRASTEVAIVKTELEEAIESGVEGTYTGVRPLKTGISGQLLADLFRKIVALRTGEALFFAPSAAIGVKKSLSKNDDGEDGNVLEAAGDGRTEIVRLGHGVLKVRVRKRVTQDGGQSIMAV